MIKNYSDELQCDMAQFYGIHNYRDFKLSHIAILACGLPEEARVIRKLEQMEYDTKTILLAQIVDRLSLIWWSKTTDAQDGVNRPVMMVDILNKTAEPMEFESVTVEEFNQIREEKIRE